MILVTGSTGTNGIEIVRFALARGRSLPGAGPKSAEGSDSFGFTWSRSRPGRSRPPGNFGAGARRRRQGPLVLLDWTRPGQAAGKLRPGGQSSGCALHREVFGDGRRHSFRMAIPA